VLPANRSEVGKQRVRDDFAAVTQIIERTTEKTVFGAEGSSRPSEGSF
jgi:hypothetical protein